MSLLTRPFFFDCLLFFSSRMSSHTLFKGFFLSQYCVLTHYNLYWSCPHLPDLFSLIAFFFAWNTIFTHHFLLFFHPKFLSSLNTIFFFSQQMSSLTIPFFFDSLLFSSSKNVLTHYFLGIFFIPKVCSHSFGILCSLFVFFCLINVLTHHTWFLW